MQPIYPILTSSIIGHMELIYPPPRKSKHNPNYGFTEFADYEQESPLNDGYAFPCRGYGPEEPVAEVQAGQTLETKFDGTANHDGGHCQFALSYNLDKFVVIKDVMNDCFASSSGWNYSVKIPTSAPSGSATFAWTWINKTGNREYYMNCADVTITNNNRNGSSMIRGPELLIVNLKGYPTIQEFPNQSDDYGQTLFDNRPTIQVGSNY